ncbi:hypothetical protein [Pseudoduganella umbonata]|uniref:Uncharacterized protein n=1 Tax=Pseudoduganella umbonata TaxID=864828 RepID=A0A7W5EJ60_9BURK|nr:hypothetical protein [Pseudoduganella umbonata]MBB3225155.1 hypothetical protein [Pseudoduganella umbonata]
MVSVTSGVLGLPNLLNFQELLKVCLKILLLSGSPSGAVGYCWTDNEVKAGAMSVP